MILSSVISVTHHYISEGIEASVCSIMIYITVWASVKSRCIFSLWLIPLNEPSVSRRVPFAMKLTSWFVLINFVQPSFLNYDSLASCSPRGRFCELSFRYLLPGSEGEKCRPLDHMWQTPFIHSVRVILSSNFYIYETFFYLFNPCGKFKGVMADTYATMAHALLNTQSHNCLVLLCRYT